MDSMIDKRKYELSIIVPVTKMHGRLDNFKKMVEDISNLSIQLIVVHDIADDKTGRELQIILENNASIKLIEGKYGSAGDARNAGLELADSEWIGFWDSDDKPEVKQYLDLVAKIKGEQNLVGYGNFLKISTIPNKLQKSKNSVNAKGAINSIKPFKNPGIWRWIFANEALKNTRFPNLKLGEDVCFLFSTLQKVDKITTSNQVIYKYFVDDPLQSTELWKNDTRVFLVIKFMKENFISNQKNQNIAFGLLVNQFYSSLKLDKLRYKAISIKLFISIFFKMNFSEKKLCVKLLITIPFNFLEK
jgi:glycosyltransferase involved in cell wall biosynthesis